jgi:fluoride exporter
MIKILYVGFGGFFGSISRYLLSGLVQKLFPATLSLPTGTFAVNMLGCLVIGFLGSIAETRQVFTAEMRMLLFIGFLGGFTTFSTFGFETFNLLRDQQYVSAISNIFLHIIIGITAVWLGFILARFVFGE